MASVTFSVPDNIKSKMVALPWINWSELAREEALKRAKLAREFEEFKRIVSKSKLTEEQALEIGKKVSASLHKKYRQLYPGLK